MRRKQRQIIAMFTIFTMLLPLIAGCGLNTSNVPAETTGTLVEEKTTEAPEPTTAEPSAAEPATEEKTTEEPTTEAPESNEVVIGEQIFTGVVGVYETDLDHDGVDEVLIVQHEEWLENHKVWVKLIKDNQVVWEDELPLGSQASGNAYLLCTQEGQDYLVRYHTYQTNFAEASYFRFYFAEGFTKEIVDSDVVRVHRIQSYNSLEFPVNSDGVNEYVAGANCVLENSFLICGRLNGEFAYSTEENRISYTESADRLMEIAFVEGPDYSECRNLDEKLAVLNQYLLNQWFVNGEIPEMPEEFKTHMAQLLTAAKERMTGMPGLAEADRSSWFADYNGEKLQMIKAEQDGGSALAAFRGEVYYRADEGETVERVAKRMVEAIAESMTVPAEGRGFTITKYLITEQNLLSWEDLVARYTDSCWNAYLREYREIGSNLLEYATEWTSKMPFQGAMALQDEMWYFVPEGYYRYEGYDLVPFEAKAENAGEMVDGMIPFAYEGMDVYFLLVKQGDVYRLQKVSCWNE